MQLKKCDIHALDAIFYGKVIYDDGFWQIAKDEYKKIKKQNNLNEISLKEMLFIV